MFQGIYYHAPLSIFGMHPNGNEDFNNYKNFTLKKLPLQFQQLLAESSSQSAEQLSRQVTLSKYHYVRSKNFHAPYKNQLFLKEHKKRFALKGEEPGNIWVFSHQENVFVGRNVQTDNIVGYLGLVGFYKTLAEIEGAERFTEVPAVVDHRFVQTRDKIYAVDFKNKKISLKHQLLTGEYYTKTVKFMFERAVFQSNKATYFIDQIDFNHKSKQVVAEHIIPHPSDLIYYDNVAITEVLNGFLLRYRDYHFNGLDKPGSALIFAQHDKTITQLASYEFTEHRISSLIRNQPFIFSPIVMNIIDGVLPTQIKHSYRAPKQYHYFWQAKRSNTILLFCLFAALFSACMTYFIASKMPMTKSNKALWTIVSLVFALPGLLAFLLLTKWQEYLFKQVPKDQQNSLMTNSPKLTAIKEQSDV